jgi:cobalt-zinc-cadmium efflux system outer membrane protein
MQSRRPVLLWCLLVAAGCHAPHLDSVDQEVADIASHPFDVAPLIAPAASQTQPVASGTSVGARSRQDAAQPSPIVIDLAPAGGSARGQPAELPADITSAGVIQVQAREVPDILKKYKLEIPKEVPGGEAPLIQIPDEAAARQKYIDQLYPGLPPLPVEPAVQLGPNGHPYTLADFQALAVANSPTLRQAISDVDAARGNLIAARAYPNPTVGIENGPNNNNTGTGTYGVFVDQVIKTGGKLKLASAAAEMDLHNAQLALKRARSDLATQVRTAYYALVVARETVRVNRALAAFTDDVFRLQADLLRAKQVSPSDPAPLRAQAATIRLAYKQAIVNYGFAWQQLVATLGLPQLPLTEIEGRVDRLIPYYDYDVVRAYVLSHHTDVLTARNGLQKARYNLQLAQVTPVPDVEIRGDVWKEQTIGPFNYFHTVSLGVPLPMWDQNKGGILSAAAALVRAEEEPHRVAVSLTNSLTTAYATYQTNLDAVEYYRRDILPDLVRYYRGIFEGYRLGVRGVPDLVTAQQLLTTNVASYLGVLGALWPAVVNVADFLQTDDLYQLGKPLEVPELPDLDAVHCWPCPHPQPVPPPAHPVHPTAEGAPIDAGHPGHLPLPLGTPQGSSPAGSRTGPAPIPNAAQPPAKLPATLPALPSPSWETDKPEQTPTLSLEGDTPSAGNPDRPARADGARLGGPVLMPEPPGR